MMKEEPVRILRGDVLPLLGGDEGRVIILAEGIEYRVEPKGAGVDLADHLSEQVEVHGVVTEDEEGLFRIRVRAYRGMDVFDDDAWYEDERA